MRDLNTQASVIGESQHEGKILRPGFGLFILTKLEQHVVRAFLQFHKADVLIDLGARVINIVGRHGSAVDPRFVGVG